MMLPMLKLNIQSSGPKFFTPRAFLAVILYCWCVRRARKALVAENTRLEKFIAEKSKKEQEAKK